METEQQEQQEQTSEAKAPREERVAVQRTYVLREMGDGVVGVALSAHAVYMLWTPERGLHYSQGGPESAERLRSAQAEFLGHEVRAISERCQAAWVRWYAT